MCPALVTTTAHGILSQVDPKTQRKFVLIAKVIQNLANGTNYGGKSSELGLIDEWIDENSSRF